MSTETKPKTQYIHIQEGATLTKSYSSLTKAKKPAKTGWTRQFAAAWDLVFKPKYVCNKHD